MNKIEDVATETWLNDQKTTTRYTYKTIWEKFTTYVKMNGDQILEDRKRDNEKLWEQRVKAFNKAMRKEYSSNYVKSMMGAIRSFFQYYEMNLRFRRATKRRLAEAHRKTKDYYFTKEELYKMSSVGDIEDQYIVCVGKSFGFRSVDFMRLTRADLEPYIDREPPISIGEYNTKKANVKAYPFIDTDAQPVIKLMLAKLDSEGKTKPTDRMLSFTDKNQLTARLRKLAKKIGIENNGRRVRFHILRKFLFDRLTSVTSDTKAKMIVGKAITESAYVSPELLREDYKRVMSMTCFGQNGVNGSKVEQLEEALKTVEDENRALRTRIDQLQKSIPTPEEWKKLQERLDFAEDIIEQLTPLLDKEKTRR